MDENNSIQLFEDRKIRTAWDEEKEEWYFSVVDVVAVLSESTDPKQYIKKMRARDPQLSANWGTICTQVQMLAADGKQMIQSGVPRAVEYGHNLFRIARAIDHQANAQMPGSGDPS